MSELPMRDEEPDETNDFGRYTPEHEPDAEDELYAVILALVEQGCGTKDHDKLDSGASPLIRKNRAFPRLPGRRHRKSIPAIQ
jgi:hypothetical protein